MKIKHSTFLNFIFLMMIVLVIFANTIQHENVHAEICRHYQAHKIQIHIGLKGGQTICTNYDNRTDTMKENEIFLHTQNEIVGYNTQQIVMSVFAVSYFFLQFALRHFKLDRKYFIFNRKIYKKKIKPL